MRLHGMDPTLFKLAVSEPELGKQIGNAMSLCVLERVFNELLPAAGFTNPVKPDRWLSGEAVKALEESRDKSFKLPDGGVDTSVKETSNAFGKIHF